MLSVLMAVYNGERYISESIQSILDQSYQNFEFLIIDDGSTDRTWSILSEFAERDSRIRLFSNDKNEGLPASLNKGIRVAQSSFLARQDADDLSLKERLSTQVDFLQNHADVGIVGTAIRYIDQHGRPGPALIPPHTHTEIRWHSLFDNAILHPTVMFRREVVMNHKLRYNSAIPLAQDYALWMHFLKYTKAYNLQTPLVHHRVHERQVSNTRSNEQFEYATRVSMRAMQEVLSLNGDALSEQEMRAFRAWYVRRIRGDLVPNQLSPLEILERLLLAFRMLPDIDLEVMDQCEAQWILDFLDRYEKKDLLRLLIFSRLQKTRVRRIEVIKAIWHRLKRKIKTSVLNL